MSTRNVFVCHASLDEEYVHELTYHVRPVIESSMQDIRLWEDSQIFAGKKWDDEIKTAIYNSVATVVVVSDNLLNSKYAMQEEMPPFLSQAAKKKIPILCLYARSCLVDEYEFQIKNNGGNKTVFLTDYQGLNSPDRPLEMIRIKAKRKQEVVTAARRLLATLKNLPRGNLRLSVTNE